MGFCHSSPRPALISDDYLCQKFCIPENVPKASNYSVYPTTACYFIVVKITELIHIFKFPTCPEYRILSSFLPSYGKRFQQLVGDLRPKGWLDAFKPEKKTHFWRGRTFKFEMTVLCLDHLMILFFLL